MPAINGFRRVCVVLIAVVLGVIDFEAVSAEGPGHVGDATKLYERLSRSVLTVEARTGSGISQGSAVVVGPGEVVTNYHVVQGALSPLILLRQGEKAWRAVVHTFDKEHDLALLAVVTAHREVFDLPPVSKRNAESLKVGERVYAVGSPRGIDRTLSEGIISGIHTLDDRTRYVQTDAAISPGSSGGGLFDASGRLAAITSLQLIDSQNLNFAVAADAVEALQRTAVPLSPIASFSVDDVAVPTSSTTSAASPVPQIQPFTLDALPAVVVVATVDQSLSALGFTSTWLRTRTELALRAVGVRVTDEKSAPLRSGVVLVTLDSLLDDDGTRCTYHVAIEIRQLVSYENKERPDWVVTWSDDSYGFAGAHVVVSAVSKAVQDRLDKVSNAFAAARPGTNVPAKAAAGSCSKDTECKGARICENHTCVDPPN